MKGRNMIEIAGYNTFEKVLPLDKVYSGDKKYYVETSDDKRLLLRISVAISN